VGAGALGPVFRAFDPDGDRLVAVKLFRLDLSPDRMSQLVATLERLVAADLRHEAIVTPIATGTDGTVVCIVQDFVSAESLDVVIRDRGTLPVPEALSVTVQLAGALDFAAVVSVHHGALHPRDVLLTQDEARVTGLGITRALEQVGVTPPVRRPYTAPERIAGVKWDRRADIFSLAALVHEMLWGRRVAGLGEDVARSLTDLAGGNLPALRTVFARALAEKPADRFDTALDFAVALQSAFPDVAIARTTTAGDAVETLHDALRASGAVEEAASSDAETALDKGRLPPDDTLAADRLKTPPETVLGDFELRLDELDRDRGTEPEMAISGAETRGGRAAKSPPSIEAKEPSRARTSLPLFDAYQADAPASGSSRAWPVAAALIIGLVLGFGGGYLVGGRQRSQPVAAVQARAQPPDKSSVPSSAPVSAAGSVGREHTEGAVTPDRADALSSVTLPPSRDALADGRGSAQGGPQGRGERGRPAAGRPEQGREATGAAPGAAADSGRLLVRSTPADAIVFVDGRERGRTPVTIGELARGTHRVRIARDGYATADRRIVITSAQPAESLAVTLDRRRAEPGTVVTQRPAPRTAATDQTATGAINVESRPAGASVYLDELLVGTTPVAMSRVAAGEHVIRLERDGYRRWSSSIRVVGGERNRVTASLER
jgi:hypothetical protein